MAAYEDPPALIRFDCERCKRGYVPPRLGQQIGLVGAARPRLLVRADDDAYREFVQSVHFCPQCRQFVCHECWSRPRQTCLRCAVGAANGTVLSSIPALPVAAPGLAFVRPAVPVVARRSGHGGRNATWVALAAALILVALGGGLTLSAFATGASSTAGTSATPTQYPSPAIDVSSPSQAAGEDSSPTPPSGASESASPSASPTRFGAPTTSPSAGSTRTARPTATRKGTPTPGPTATPTPTPTPTPTATPTVTPLDAPTIACTASLIDVGPSYTVECHETAGSAYQSKAGDVLEWLLDDHGYGDTHSWTIDDSGPHFVELTVSRSGTSSVTSNKVTGSSVDW